MSAGPKVAVSLCAVLGTSCVVGAPVRPSTAESAEPPAQPDSEKSAQQLLGPRPGTAADGSDRPPAPRAGHRWVEGYWHWSGVEYVWVPGHWEPIPAGSSGG